MSQPSISHHARVGPADAGDHVQQRGLARAAAAHQHDLLAGGHVEVPDIQNRQQAAVGLAKRLADILEQQHGRFPASLLESRGRWATGHFHPMPYIVLGYRSSQGQIRLASAQRERADRAIYALLRPADARLVRLPILPDAQSAISASTSISIIMAGSTSRVTSTIVDAGRIVVKELAVSPAVLLPAADVGDEHPRADHVVELAPAWASARSMFLRVCTVWA